MAGAPGERAHSRRKDIGSLCGKYADLAIFTADDPGFEDPLIICKQMEAFAKEWLIEKTEPAFISLIRMQELYGKGKMAITMPIHSHMKQEDFYMKFISLKCAKKE